MKSRRCPRLFYPLICIAITFFSMNASASWLVENDVALGVEGGNLNYGLSMKLPHSAEASWQLTANAGANVNSFGGRYLSYYSQWNDTRVYWYAGASIWTWSGNRFYGSETVVGVGAGIGWDYDLIKSGAGAPISLNATIGPSYAAFSNYSGLDLLNVGFGIHYRFK